MVNASHGTDFLDKAKEIVSMCIHPDSVHTYTVVNIEEKYGFFILICHVERFAVRCDSDTDENRVVIRKEIAQIRVDPGNNCLLGRNERTIYMTSTSEKAWSRCR